MAVMIKFKEHGHCNQRDLGSKAALSVVNTNSITMIDHHISGMVLYIHCLLFLLLMQTLRSPLVTNFQI